MTRGLSYDVSDVKRLWDLVPVGKYFTINALHSLFGGFFSFNSVSTFYDFVNYGVSLGYFSVLDLGFKYIRKEEAKK